jgi:hypothetical protein
MKWKDNIKMDLTEVSYEDEKWMELDQSHVQWWALVLHSATTVLLIKQMTQWDFYVQLAVEGTM